MSRINKLKKLLVAKNVKNYRIIETENTSYQQFYDLQKIETVRKVNTLENQVTIYTETEIDGNKFIGDASFIVSHDDSSANLNKLIDDCIYQTSFIHNQYYPLPSADKKKSMAYKPLEEAPYDILKNIAKIFFSVAKENVRFNALELFFDEQTIHIVNSNGVDYKKKIFTIKAEAIPSFYGDNYKTELYRMFTYNELNYDKVLEDANEAINDIYNRGKAVNLKDVNKCNIILHGKDMGELFDEVIGSLSYQSVYSHSNIKNIGEAISKKKLNIALDAANKFDYFDADGIKLAKAQIIKDGVVTSYFGNNRFAYYLGVKPTGNLNKLVLKNGKKVEAELKKDKYVEIFDLSGLQVDAYQNYLGGEVRLALYYDGDTVTPITGFSFSVDLNEAINAIELSKEVTNTNRYNGPKFGLIKNVTLN